MKKPEIFCAIRANNELEYALNSTTKAVFMLSPNIMDIKKQADAVHKAGKKYFIHIDFAEGLGKDEQGIMFAKKLGADGIISTRTNLIKLAKSAGLFTVQRFFIIDSHSVNTTIATAKASKADMIEIMPGTVSKVIKSLKAELDMPIVAGGLIETIDEINEAIKCGAAAVSTSKKEFWK